MLKDLIQLFAETFIKGKKSWVAEQCAPIVRNGTNIPCTSTTDFFSYVAPCNGWATSRSNSSTVSALEIQVENGQMALASVLNGNTAGCGLCCYVKKGTLLNSYAEVERLRIILFGSTKQVQTFNPLTGGALC